MTAMKIVGKLPDGAANGLTAVRDQLVKDPDSTVVGWIVLNVKSVTSDLDTGEDMPLPRVAHIEIADEGPEAREVARQLVAHREVRLGRPMRTLDLGDDLLDLLGVDRATGEIRDGQILGG